MNCQLQAISDQTLPHHTEIASALPCLAMTGWALACLAKTDRESAFSDQRSTIGA